LNVTATGGALTVNSGVGALGISTELQQQLYL
jgi:hypothetical protein